MVVYSLEALGRFVERRRALGLTQEQLGELAGYKPGPGAGVSISRFENGQLVPTPERFEGITRALGLLPSGFPDGFVQDFEEATDRSWIAEHGDRARAQRRQAMVQLQIDHITTMVTALGQAFDAAVDLAKTHFLMRLIGIAANFDGSPKPDPAQLPGDSIPTGEGIQAEAAYCIQFTKYGVAQALAGTANAAAAPAGADAAAAYSVFMAAVARWTASAGATIPLLAGTAPTNGFIAALHVGTPPARSLGSASRTARLMLIGEAAVTLRFADVLLGSAKRNRRQQRELAANLDEAEAELDDSRPNVDALTQVMLEAIHILDYIGVHARHALNRWEHQLGPEPRDWASLSEAEWQRYQDLVEIAAAQIAVANIDIESLVANRGDALERSNAFASEIVTLAQKVVTSHA